MTHNAAVAPSPPPRPPAAAVVVLPPRQSTSHRITVSQSTFIMIWWAVQLIHMGLIGCSLGVIELHRYLTAQRWEGGVNYMGPSVFGFFPIVTFAHSVIVVGHAVALLHSLWWSLRYREWRFTDKPRESICITTTTTSGTPPPKSCTNTTTPKQETTGIKSNTTYCCMIATTPVRRAWLALFSSTGLFGVEGKYYESSYFVLKVVEIGFQIFQAYKLSQLVPRVWINRLNTAVVVLNCWTTAIVDRYFFRGGGHDHGDCDGRVAKRIVLLLVDCVFDVVACIVIPLAIFLPYFFEFDLTRNDFPVLNYYHDVWLIQAISENKQIFVTSWVDLVSKLSPRVTVLAGLLVLKTYVVVATPGADQRPRVRSSMFLSAISIIVPAMTRPRTKGPTRALVTGRAHRSGDPHTWQHVFLAACGLAVLVVHIHTTTIAVLSRTPGCLLEVRPWFASTYSCVALELNCARGEYDDGSNTTLIHGVFQSLRPAALKSLVLASCSQLHIPPIFQALTSLQVLKIYNSTVAEWDATAELRDSWHPDLQFLYVSDTNFSSTRDGEFLPIGLLGDAFPVSLVDIEFSGTNLVGLPGNLHEKWGYVEFFFLERSVGITEFPATLAKMQIPNLALGSNRITHIPEELLSDQVFWYLMLDGNPLTALPNKIGDFSAMYLLGISFTNITKLPEWITSVQLDRRTGKQMRPLLDHTPVFASGSPLCGDAESRALAMSAMQRWFQLNCATEGATAYMYPIEQERNWRAATLANFP